MILLEARSLVKNYGKKAVVDELSFEVYPGEVVGLLGSNGAGKTTAFYMTMGLIKPDKGDIFFKGEKITKVPVHKRAQMGIGYLAQEPSIFRDLSVEDNILCVLEMLPISKQERYTRLSLLLNELHLEPLKKKNQSSCLAEKDVALKSQGLL